MRQLAITACLYQVSIKLLQTYFALFHLCVSFIVLVVWLLGRSNSDNLLKQFKARPRPFGFVVAPTAVANVNVMQFGTVYSFLMTMQQTVIIMCLNFFCSLPFSSVQFEGSTDISVWKSSSSSSCQCQTVVSNSTSCTQ